MESCSTDTDLTLHFSRGKTLRPQCYFQAQIFIYLKEAISSIFFQQGALPEGKYKDICTECLEMYLSVPHEFLYFLILKQTFVQIQH